MTHAADAGNPSPPTTPTAGPAAHRDTSGPPVTPAARVAGLTKTYGTGDARWCALDDVTLDLYAGEFTAVMGPERVGQVDADALLRGARPGRLGARCSSASRT